MPGFLRVREVLSSHLPLALRPLQKSAREVTAPSAFTLFRVFFAEKHGDFKIVINGRVFARGGNNEKF